MSRVHDSTAKAKKGKSKVKRSKSKDTASASKGHGKSVKSTKSVKSAKPTLAPPTADDSSTANPTSVPNKPSAPGKPYTPGKPSSSSKRHTSRPKTKSKSKSHNADNAAARSNSPAPAPVPAPAPPSKPRAKDSTPAAKSSRRKKMKRSRNGSSVDLIEPVGFFKSIDFVFVEDPANFSAPDKAMNDDTALYARNRTRLIEALAEPTIERVAGIHNTLLALLNRINIESNNSPSVVCKQEDLDTLRDLYTQLGTACENARTVKPLDRNNRHTMSRVEQIRSAEAAIAKAEANYTRVLSAVAKVRAIDVVKSSKTLILRAKDAIKHHAALKEQLETAAETGDRSISPRQDHAPKRTSKSRRAASRKKAALSAKRSRTATGGARLKTLKKLEASGITLGMLISQTLRFHPRRLQHLTAAEDLRLLLDTGSESSATPARKKRKRRAAGSSEAEGAQPSTSRPAAKRARTQASDASSGLADDAVESTNSSLDSSRSDLVDSADSADLADSTDSADEEYTRGDTAPLSQFLEGREWKTGSGSPLVANLEPNLSESESLSDMDDSATSSSNEEADEDQDEDQDEEGEEDEEDEKENEEDENGEESEEDEEDEEEAEQAVESGAESSSENSQEEEREEGEEGEAPNKPKDRRQSSSSTRRRHKKDDQADESSLSSSRSSSSDSSLDRLMSGREAPVSTITPRPVDGYLPQKASATDDAPLVAHKSPTGSAAPQPQDSSARKRSPTAGKSPALVRSTTGSKGPSSLHSSTGRKSPGLSRSSTGGKRLPPSPPQTFGQTLDLATHCNDPYCYKALEPTATERECDTHTFVPYRLCDTCVENKGAEYREGCPYCNLQVCLLCFQKASLFTRDGASVMRCTTNPDHVFSYCEDCSGAPAQCTMCADDGDTSDVKKEALAATDLPSFMAVDFAK